MTAQKTNPLLEVILRKLCFRPNQKKKTKREEEALSPRAADHGSVVKCGDGDNDQRRSQEREPAVAAPSDNIMISNKEELIGEEERVALSSSCNEAVETKKYCMKDLNNRRRKSVWDDFQKGKQDPLYDLWSLHLQPCARNTHNSSTNACLLGGRMRYSCC